MSLPIFFFCSQMVDIFHGLKDWRDNLQIARIMRPTCKVVLYPKAGVELGRSFGLDLLFFTPIHTFSRFRFLRYLARHIKSDLHWAYPECEYQNSTIEFLRLSRGDESRHNACSSSCSLILGENTRAFVIIWDKVSSVMVENFSSGA